MADLLSASERLECEMALLEAMYPDSVRFTPKSREVFYHHDNGATLTLRLPDQYPDGGLPDVIAANDAGAAKSDLRAAMKDSIKRVGLVAGEESLDAIIAAFQELLARRQAETESHPSGRGTADVGPATMKTVVVWLHHLLATGKRKLALNPELAGVSGITKPGYPGVMVFSGEKASFYTLQMRFHNPSSQPHILSIVLVAAILEDTDTRLSNFEELSSSCYSHSRIFI